LDNAEPARFREFSDDKLDLVARQTARVHRPRM